MAERSSKQHGKNMQNVDENVSPIYQPLGPEWNETATIHRPLMARGDFSNAWVLYDESELPPHVRRPSALIESEGSQEEQGTKRE